MAHTLVSAIKALFYMYRLKIIIKVPVLELFYEILKISPDFTAGSPFTIFLFHKLGTCANCIIISVQTTKITDQNFTGLKPCVSRPALR